MTARTRELGALAKQIKPDVILLAHGASLSEPEDAQYILENSECHGVQVGSSIERLAIEKPLQQRAASFKATHFPKGASRLPSQSESTIFTMDETPKP